MDGATYEQVAALLAEQQGIDRESIYPQSRLIEDLGVWGDDIVEFFEAVTGRFGTDISALQREWSRYFPAEGGSWRSILFGLPALILGGVGAGFAVSATALPPLWAGPVAVTLVYALLWLASRAFPPPAFVAVTVGEVADAVARGRW